MIGNLSALTQHQMHFMGIMAQALATTPGLNIAFDEPSKKKLENMKKFDTVGLPKAVKQIQYAMSKAVAKYAEFKIVATLNDSSRAEREIGVGILAVTENARLMRDKSTRAPARRDTGATVKRVQVTARQDGRLVVEAGDRTNLLVMQEYGYTSKVTAKMKQYAMYQALKYERQATTSAQGAVKGSLFDALSRWQDARSRAWAGLAAMDIGTKIYVPPRPVVVPAVRKAIDDLVRNQALFQEWGRILGNTWFHGEQGYVAFTGISNAKIGGYAGA